MRVYEGTQSRRWRTIQHFIVRSSIEIKALHYFIKWQLRQLKNGNVEHIEHQVINDIDHEAKPMTDQIPLPRFIYEAKFYV